MTVPRFVIQAVQNSPLHHVLPANATTVQKNTFTTIYTRYVHRVIKALLASQQIQIQVVRHVIKDRPRTLGIQIAHIL